MKKIKKAQHEIVGFVLIVVIVVVIGLFLLVFYLRQPAVEHESLNVQNFLQSSMAYTTDCMRSIEPLDLQDLIKTCKENKRCLNEELACKVLNDTLSELAHESWLVSEDRPENAYFLNIYYQYMSKDEEESEKEEILSLKEGNCTGSRTGAEYLLHYSPGTIIIDMKLCYT